jgi:hypothetical protein
MTDAESVAPMTVDVDKKNGKMEIRKSWEHELMGILESPRRAEMTFHIPIVDKDKEIITAGAMADAIEDYRNFPIISEFHKERPIGIAERIWRTKDDEFKALVRIRDDRATDDVWEKINLPAGTPGRYDQVSIAGKRIVYNDQCNVPQAMRSEKNPCKTEKLRLDSISVCDDRARNEGTEFNVVKAESDDPESFIYTTALEITKVEDTLIKAETTDSELIHPVTDGAHQTDERGTKKCRKCSKGEQMAAYPKKGNPVGTLPMKKTSDEDAEASVEETEAKKGGKTGEPELDGMKKGEEKLEEEESSEMKMMREILSTLKQLVSSDKSVHKEVEKSKDYSDDDPKNTEDWKDKEENKERKKEARSEENRAEKEEHKEDGGTPRKEYKEGVGAGSGVKKAAMEQDFQKALDAAVAPLQLQLNALAGQVQQLGDQPMFKSGLYLQTLTSDQNGSEVLGNAGALSKSLKNQRDGRK